METLREFYHIGEGEFQKIFDSWSIDNKTKWEFVGIPTWLKNRKAKNTKDPEYSLNDNNFGILGEYTFRPDVLWKTNKITLIELKKSKSGCFEEIAFIE